MTLRHVHDLKTPIGELLKDAAAEGVLLEAGNQTQYAMIPLDDDLLDYLLERNPKFIDECNKIRGRMRKGSFISHDQVKKLASE
jgi:hypothetical protein